MIPTSLVHSGVSCWAREACLESQMDRNKLPVLVEKPTRMCDVSPFQKLSDGFKKLQRPSTELGVADSQSDGGRLST
jgi:hypothetical protein